MGERIEYTHHRDGGLTISLSLTPQETQAVDSNAADLADLFDTVLWSLAMLRTGQVHSRPERPEVGEGDWYIAVNDTRRLLEKVQGIQDAAIRQHAALGGSLGKLANALDTSSRSGAQHRRRALLAKVPSAFEEWATAGGPGLEGFDILADSPSDPAEVRERAIEDWFEQGD